MNTDKLQTPAEWLAERLPAEYVERIKKNGKVQHWNKWDEPTIGHASILSMCFIWDSSPEKYDFWEKVWHHLDNPDNPLPPLP